MWSRVAYTLRETWASFQRNITLTVATIITAAVSLLIFGLTLLLQEGFSNLLSRWEDGVELIVFVQPEATDDQRAVIEEALDGQQGQNIERWTYCDAECSFDDAQRLLAGDPSTLEMLSLDNVPTQYKVVPTEGTDVLTLQAMRTSYQENLPSVENVILAEDELELISRLQGFVGLYTTGLWISLMIAATLLIWNTIRTAMFARRREIEVMKLVGATDWFIRLPFMLEGLLQGVIGGVTASAALRFINDRWTSGVQDFPDGTGFTALVVSSGYLNWTTLWIILFGAAVGMIGSGIAASRFLDV